MPVDVGKITEEECLIQVKRTLQESEDLSNILSVLNDDELLTYVRGRKYKPDQAINTIRKRYKVWKKYPEIFRCLLPSRVKIDKRIFNILRHEDELGRPTLLVYLQYWNPDDIKIDDLIREGHLLMDTILRYNQGAQKYGMNIILNVDGLSLQQCRQITPFVVQKLVNLFWGSFPVQYKHACIVNSPWCFTMLMNMIRSFLPKKLNERLSLHTPGDWKKFHQKFDPSILPASLAGTVTDEDKCFSTKIYLQKLSQSEPFYISLQQLLDVQDVY